MAVIDWQPWNGLMPIDCTDAGMVIEVSPAQSNARSSMVVSVVGSEIDVNAEQSPNAAFPILMTLLPKYTLANPRHP